MTPDKNFLWADDLASFIKAHPNRAKEYIKIYFESLIQLGFTNQLQKKCNNGPFCPKDFL